MKNSSVILIPWFVLLLGSIMCSDGQVKSLEFYVSTEGIIGNPGTYSQPFSTLIEAQSAVRQALKSDGAVPPLIKIYIRQGIYRMTETLDFTQLDSGTKERPVVWSAYEDEEVILIGGQTLKDFTHISDQDIRERLSPEARDHVVEADLSTFANQLRRLNETGFGKEIQPSGSELFFKGEPMILARYPDTSWLVVDAVPQSGTMEYEGDVANPGASFDGIPGGRHFGRFVLKDDRPRNWMEQDIWMHGYWTWDWADMYEKVDGFDHDKFEVFLSKPYHQYGIRRGQRFYFLNVFEELNSPGEYYIHQEKSKLYFWPPEDPESGDLMISLLDKPLIKFENTSHLQILGISFEASCGSAVEIYDGQSILLAGCTFRNLGNYAVWIEGGYGHTVLSCDINNIGDGGIYLEGGTRETLTSANHLVKNCHIHHFSRINRTGRPAVTLKGVGSKLVHNYIHDAPHMGVWFDGNEHLLEFNEIHDVAKETGDVGAFYIGRDWTCRGNIIRHNYFHHLHGPGLHGVMAVYLDDWTSGTTVFGNIFYKSGRSAFIGGGRDNIIENNLFIECKPSVHVDARGLGWASYYFDQKSEHFVPTLFDRLEAMNVDQPPFSTRYPSLQTLVQDDPAVPKGNRVINNISTGGRWLDFHNGLDFAIIEVKQNVIADSILMRWTSQRDKLEEFPTREDSLAISLLQKNGNIVLTQDLDLIALPRRKIYIDTTDADLHRHFQPIPVHRIGLQTDEFRRSLN